MSRAETSDSTAAPVERVNNNFSSGDTMTSKSDSDLARSASYSTTNDVSSLLDPKGNEFGIDGLDNTHRFDPDNPQGSRIDGLDGTMKFSLDQGNGPSGQTGEKIGDTGTPKVPGQETDKNIQKTEFLAAGDQSAPGQIHTDNTSITVNSEDGLTKSVITGNQQEKLQFSPDGHLHTFAQTDNDGTTTTTTFDDNGKATARSQKNAYGEYSKLDVPDATVQQTVGPDGRQKVTIIENGNQTSFGIGADGKIFSETKGSDAHQQWKLFDGKGGVEFEGRTDQEGNITESTVISNGHFERRTVDSSNGETDIHRVDQFHHGQIDTRFQRTEDLQIHKDGSTDGVTRRLNEPGSAYRYHLDAQGNATTAPRQTRRV